MLFSNITHTCSSLPTVRQYLSNDDCLEDKGKVIRTVLCCFVYDSCARWYAHTCEQFLNLSVCLHLGLVFMVGLRLTFCDFGRPFVKWFALCYRTVVCLLCLSVTLVYCGHTVELDQDETWRGDRPRLRPHCVRWGPTSPQRGTAPQLSAHVSCSQTTG